VKVRLNWVARKVPLEYPVPPAPPVAVLSPWFRPSGAVRVFRGGWGAAAAAFAPAAIAATWEQLEALLPEKVPSLDHALIVLARPGGRLLTDVHRERLWTAFRVPVFEQIVGPRGVLLAAECEAHDGLHVDLAKLEPSKVEVGQLASNARHIDMSPCGCGRKTPRLKVASPRHTASHDKRQAAAAR
jgi:hypothetical protein